MKVFIFICVHAWETNTHARVKLFKMSRSCCRWSVSQFSTCMSLLRHGCQSHSFWNSQDDSQMYTFRDQMNWQFVQCTGHRWRKTKDFFDFCSGKICLVLFHGFFFCFRHLCPVHEVNAKTPITAILFTHLLHEFIVNVNCRMDWSCRKPYICLSLNFLKQTILPMEHV